MFEEIIRKFFCCTMNLGEGTSLTSALSFFFYDTVKIFFLISVVIFVVAVVRSFFPAEKTREVLAKTGKYTGNVLAAFLGIVTPFCSCSAVPLFLGFVEAGIPLGITFSFLVSSPMINEIAVVLLWSMFGWKISMLYIWSGLVIAVVAGIVIGKMKLEYLLEDIVKETSKGSCVAPAPNGKIPFKARLSYAYDYTKEILGKIWPYVLVAVGIGAWIHGYVPQDVIGKIAGKGNPFAVPLAVLVGIPLYSNCGGALPLVHALVEKGVQVGTALAFMMAVTALSLPEFIILRNVMKPKLIAIFAGVVGIGIIITGYMFNFILG
ncbi:MAG: permease [Candidatus Firestonebacteria bacterium]